MKSDRKREKRTGSFWNFEDEKKLEEERNSFCCNACVCQVTPYSCHNNGQKLDHQLINNRPEKGSNVDC